MVLAVLSEERPGESVLNEGTIRRFIPVCVRTRLGYYAGPIGYVESETCPGPIVLDVRKLNLTGGDNHVGLSQVDERRR